MRTLWNNAILPLLISGLIIFVTNFFGTDFIGWIISIAIVVLPIILILWIAKPILRSVNPLLSETLPNFCGQRPGEIARNHLTYIDIVGALKFLQDVIKKDKFVPDLVIGIDRGGAALGGILAKLFKCPFSHLASSPQWSLSSSEHSIDEGLKNNNVLNEKWQGKINNILIVDDACRSGETLDAAINFIKNNTQIQGQIKVATLLNELRPHKTIRVDYICFDTRKIKDQHLRLPWDLSPTV